MQSINETFLNKTPPPFFFSNLKKNYSSDSSQCIYIKKKLEQSFFDNASVFCDMPPPWMKNFDLGLGDYQVCIYFQNAKTVFKNALMAYTFVII